MKSDYELKRAVDRYADTVRRICLLYLKNYHDTEDIFQNVFLKYCLYNKEFQNDEHEKAWIIRVTVNACKDFLKSFYHKNIMPVEAIQDMAVNADNDQSLVLEAVLSLPQKYKDTVYLFYYEGYTASEISKITGKKENTIYTFLARARKLLKEMLGGEDFE
ncbi:MAG: sigma-70 family RNA polymerase sigma factor [Clostridia bacterium]|nr:sigma-70 family RNA polymerase sigma factor [Clostridia bacterium]